MSRIHLLLSALALGIPLTAAAETEIFSAKVSTVNTFLISGHDFGHAPKAQLQGVPLIIVAASDLKVEAKVPAGLGAGTYNLKVAKDGHFGVQTSVDEIDITLGAQGPQGQPGQMGPQGPMGIIGPEGQMGPRGLTGPQGPQGVAGAQGPQGVAGTPGLKGDAGAQGPQGVAGPQGPKGDAGAQGPQGVAGAQGPMGDHGVAGMNGADGRLSVDGTSPGQVATWNGSNWIAAAPRSVSVQVDNMQPFLALNYQIALYGIFPSRNASDPYIGEIMLVGWNFAAVGWALCDGQLLSINQNEALFALLGTTYGGNGQTTFALPDLRGRVAIHMGSGPGLSTRTIGDRAGTETNTVNF